MNAVHFYWQTYWFIQSIHNYFESLLPQPVTEDQHLLFHLLPQGFFNL